MSDCLTLYLLDQKACIAGAESTEIPDTNMMSGAYKHIMWPDLRKAGFHAHNSKTHFLPSNNSCTRWLTIQPGIDAECCPGCFCCGLFLRLVRRPRVYESPSNGCISPWQADSWLLFTTQLADEFSHGFNYFVWYVEVKMTPMDAIWLVLVKT